MKAFAFVLVISALGAFPAQASPYPVHTELQRGETLVIEHTPVPGTVRRSRVKRVTVAPARRRAGRSTRRVRTARTEAIYLSSSIAGGCRDGGLVRRHRPDLGTLVPQREVCDSIAPISSLPPPYDPRRRIPSF